MRKLDENPLELKEIINEFEVVEEINGRIDDKIIKLSNNEEKIFFLKISETVNAQKEMYNEYKLLNWLFSTELIIPKVLFYQNSGNRSYMLLSTVPGTGAHEIGNHLNKEEIIKLSAEALRAVHKIDGTSIPREYQDCLEVELQNIALDVKNDMIDVMAFKNVNEDRSPDNVLEYLLEKRSIFNTDVFTHGDYCLPNILIDGVDRVGYVDWSQAGIGDIYRDIASMIKSIRRNFGESYSELFFKYYGIAEDVVDMEKINYYDLIDQFCYYKKTKKE